MIGKCKTNCKHPSQDEIHGPGNRVLNHVPGIGKNFDEYRCTVCGTVHTPEEARRR